MTLPPEKLGDKGQRFELHAIGWPKEGDNVIGWGEDKWSLADAGHSLLEQGPVTEAYLIDRKMEERIDIER